VGWAMFLTSKNTHNPFEDYLQYLTADIYNFCREIGVTPTSQQEELLDQVQKGSRRIAVRSGMGPGKTFTAGIVGMFASIRHRSHKLIVTAPTMSQCKDAWLAQAKKLIVENPEANAVLQNIFDFTETGFGILNRKQNVWGCMLKAARDSDRARGQHENHMGVIFEEASAIDRQMWHVYKSTLTGPDNWMLAIGNPSIRSSAFFDCFYGPDKHTWVQLHWNAEETVSPYYNSDQAKQLAREYGKESDVYRVNVLGEFPKQDADAVLSTELIDPLVTDTPDQHLRYMMEPGTLIPDQRGYKELCLDPQFGDRAIRRQISLDYARKGGDENAIYAIQGNATLSWWTKSMIEPAETTRRAIKYAEDFHWKKDKCTFVPDSSGMGQGCIGTFYEEEWQAFEFHNHGKPLSREYANRITEAYFWIRKKVLAECINVPDDPILIRQLTTRKYMIDPKGRPIMVPKDQHRSENGESPDRADAFVMAHYPCAISSGFDIATR